MMEWEEKVKPGMKLTILEARVKGFLEYSFAGSVDKKFNVKKKRRDRGPALTVTDYMVAAASLDFATWTGTSVCWPLTVKVDV